MDLEFLALSWLRFEKNCPVAMFERNPRWGTGQPDVLGITKHRYLLEIEIKRSMSDFRANSKKPHIANRGLMTDDSLYPKHFWYLVPPDLAGKCEAELPPWAGLLRGPMNDERQVVQSVVRAPTNEASQRLSVKECAKLFHCMANQIYSQAKVIRYQREAHAKNDYWNFFMMDYVI